MNLTLTLVFFLVVLALTFDFLNGFHDAANSVATVVTTRVLSPTGAVLGRVFQFRSGVLLRHRSGKDHQPEAD
jgi:phosphate/sulfate permease